MALLHLVMLECTVVPSVEHCVTVYGITQEQSGFMQDVSLQLQGGFDVAIWPCNSAERHSQDMW